MMEFWKKEKDIFLLSLGYYTRLPVLKYVDYSEEKLNSSTRYVAVVGWIVGGISYFVYILFSYVSNESFGVFASLVAGIWVTGAFHEDGFTDTVDAFGGGWTKKQILEIMKDSRIGTFGAIALVLMVLGKFLLLDTLAKSLQGLQLFFVFLLYHSLARIAPVYLAFFSKYVRSQGKGKPVAEKIHIFHLVFATVLGLIPFGIFLYLTHPVFAVMFPVLAMLVIYLKSFFEKWIDGITGDCLGATEQLSELVILFNFVMVWKFM